MSPNPCSRREGQPENIMPPVVAVAGSFNIVVVYPSGALALECAQVLIKVSIVWKRSASVTWLTLRSSTSRSFTNCMANATAM